MPSYSGNAFSLEEAHAAATTAGFKPSRLGSRGRFSFNSRACHIGGDNPTGCWADDKTAAFTSTATNTRTPRPIGWRPRSGSP